MAVASERQAGSFLEQDSTEVPKFAYRSFCPCGIKGTRGAYIRIADRRAAVAYAFDHAREGDIIVLAGKGHEDYQEIGGVRYPMEDKELVKKAAEGRGR